MSDSLKCVHSEPEIFHRMRNGATISPAEPGFKFVQEEVDRTLRLCTALNACSDAVRVRDRLGEITCAKIDESTTLFAPLHANFGRFITIGKNVFINGDCTFLALGGITIEDDVLIGPKVSLITENHPLDPAERRNLRLKPVIIKRNAWIGAGAIILPGVTVGEYSVVAAGAVVNRDVPANTVVGGVPAKILKTIDGN
jgi:acetyltransferase-like isoleucine patch superfamily enzyme